MIPSAAEQVARPAIPRQPPARESGQREKLWGMSQLLIQQYLNQLETLKKVSGTTRESVVREAFKELLKGWARSHDLTFVPEHEIAAPTKERRYVDGALMHTLRVPFGYWEAKDTEDELHAAIEKKLRAGYPKTNIIFENSRHALLIQHGQEVIRCFVDDVIGLEKLLKLFFAYERPEIEAFRKAVEQFKQDLPAVLDALRKMIEREYAQDAKFRKAAHEFLVHVQEAVNPSLSDADVREMLIQHVLTSEVFAAVFPARPTTRTTISPASCTSSRTPSSPATPVSRPSRGSSPTTPPSARPLPRSRPTPKSRPSSRRSTRTSTRSTTRRPPTAWALSTRRTRSCAS
jgi:hypothetical protein